MVFDTVTLSEGFFSGPNKVNCAAPYSELLVYFLSWDLDADACVKVVGGGLFMAQMMAFTCLTCENPARSL